MGWLTGSSSPPSYQPNSAWSKLTFDKLYPKLTEGIDAGGFGFDTAGLERTFKENNATNYGGALQRVRAFTAPHGNITAGNRMALRLATDQARTESTGIRDIRTQNAAAKNQSQMGLLGMVSGMEDPAYKAYYAELARYHAQTQKDQQLAGMLGNLAGLGTSLYLGGPPATNWAY
jgi:hypothetical protein